MRARVSPMGIKEIPREPSVHAYVYLVAQMAAGEARKIAPVSHDKAPGQFKAGIGATMDSTPDACATVFDSNKGWLLEYGAMKRTTKSGTPNPFKPIPVLHRAVQRLGLKFTEKK